MSGLFLLVVGVLSIAGIYYIYKKEYDEAKTKKYITVLLALIIVLSASFMVIDAKTREIALMQGEQNQATLAIMLGWNYGGYSPYLQETWGGTGPNDDFDRDGVINQYDPDADGDGVADYLEPMNSMRFNPFFPDVGIQKIRVRWDTESSIRIIATPTPSMDIIDTNAKITLYINNDVIEVKSYDFLSSELTFVASIDSEIRNVIELRAEGIESNFANKANNHVAYTIPPGITGEIGKWYYNLENEIQGIVKNTPLYQSTSGIFSSFDNLVRNTVAGVPLILWLALIIGLCAIIVILLRRRKEPKENKRSLLGFLKGKKKKRYEPGDLVIKRY